MEINLSVMAFVVQKRKKEGESIEDKKGGWQADGYSYKGKSKDSYPQSEAGEPIVQTNIVQDLLMKAC